MLKKFLFLISLAFLFSCSSNGGNEEKQEPSSSSVADTPSSSSIVQNSSSSEGQSCSSSVEQSCSSSQAVSSTSVDLCAGFVEGTERMHYGKLKKQICDKRDGKKYVYITIDMGETSQTWLAENLNYDGGNGSIGKCYENDISNCDIYGRLYDWNEAMAINPACNPTSCANQITSKHRGICPSGWHIPSYADYDKLYRFAEEYPVYCEYEDNFGICPTAGKHLKTTSGWYDLGNGTDTYGFSALPGGMGLSEGNFAFGGMNGYWWAADENYTYYAYNLVIRDIKDRAYLEYFSKLFPFSIRCVEGE